MSFYCIETGYTSIFHGILDHPIYGSIFVVKAVGFVHPSQCGLMRARNTYEPSYECTLYEWMNEQTIIAMTTLYGHCLQYILLSYLSRLFIPLFAVLILPSLLLATRTYILPLLQCTQASQYYNLNVCSAICTYSYNGRCYFPRQITLLRDLVYSS